ncbi:MAG: NmrA/HSCARG family protein [Thermoplasmata archaeon]
MPHSKELAGRSSEPKRVLVTGATGQQGGGLARILLQRGHHVRAMSRKPDGPAAIELRKLGAEVVTGDLGDRASVERAAKGVDVAYLVATPYEQGPEAEVRFGRTGLDGIHAAGVPYLVYSSVSDADRKTGIPHFDSKAKIEEYLKSLGTEHSIVAPVFFNENLFAPWVSAGFALGVLATGVFPDRRLQVISLPEIAEFTALAVEQPRSFRGKRINIASDEPTPNEIARQLSEVAGTKVAYQAIPLDQVRKQSEDFAKMYDWFNRVGYSVDIPKLKHDYPQVRWRSFREWSRMQDWSRVLPASTKP